MSFYISGLSDIEERRKHEEELKQKALDELSNIWMQLSKDEKAGILEAISQIGKEHKIKRLMDEQSKIARELNRLNNS